MNSQHPDNPVQPDPPAVQTPIDASGTATAVLARQVILQLLLVAGTLIAALGLSEKSTIAQVVRFLQSETALPLIGAVAALGSSIYLQWRAKRKHRQVQTLASLPGVPDTVAIGPKTLSPAVERAVEAATVEIDAIPAPKQGEP